MPICGVHKVQHDTVDEVRACYVAKYGGSVAITPEAAQKGAAVTAVKYSSEEQEATAVLDRMSKDSGEPLWPASEKQIKYVLGLQDERRLPEDYHVVTADDLAKMERDEVSGKITMLRTFPHNSPSHSAKQWLMPAGRFAIHHEDKDEWWFFEISKPTEGRWKGYTFIKRLIGAPGQYRKLTMSAGERVGWLDAIEKDPKQAMIDYGLRSGVCGRCASPLTDPESLARGIGPVCATKSGWF